MIQMSVLGLRRMGTDVYSIINQKTASMKSAADKERRTEMNKDWNSSTSDYEGKPMEIKRWKVVIDSENCPHTSAINMCLLYETDINLSNEHLMDCTYENCPAKHITRPDPAEVERLAEKYSNFITESVIRHHGLSMTMHKGLQDSFKLETKCILTDLLKLEGG